MHEVQPEGKREWKPLVKRGSLHRGQNTYFIDYRRDLARHGKLYPGLFAVTPIQMFLRQHMGKIQKFPHRDPGTPKNSELTPHD